MDEGRQHGSTTWDHDALRALGLLAHESTVLEALCLTAGTTPADLAAVTGLSRPQVSTAVRRLAVLELVEVDRAQRPHHVRLSTDVEAPVRALQDRTRSRLADDLAAASGGAELLRRQAALLHQVPHSLPRSPRRRGLGTSQDPRQLVPRTRYEEVARLTGTTVQHGGPVRRGPAVRRLLVLGQPPASRRRWWEHHGVQVRTTTADLPVVVVVDDVRARVELGSAAVSRHGWTEDAAQVAALGQLFALWWEAAQS